MSLSVHNRRAYLEARHRQRHAEPSIEWIERPGSPYALEVWMNAFTLAAEENVSPWDALLLVVRRRAARVRAVDNIINTAWADHRRLCEADPTYGNPDVPSSEVRTWMGESRNEERLLARAAKMAVDAGVADAIVRRLELEGQLATDALVAGLDVLDLTPEQRMRALSTMHRTLAQLPPGTDMPGTIEGLVLGDKDDDASGSRDDGTPDQDNAAGDDSA